MLFLSIGCSYSENQFLFPKEKPSIFKKIKKDEGQNFSNNLPQKKPLPNETNEPDVKVKKEIKDIKKEVQAISKKDSFVFPEKKPSIYKSKTIAAEKSTILNQKDFERAKETIQFIKDKK